MKVLNNIAADADIELFDHMVARGADPSQSLAMHYVSKCKDPQRSVAMLSHLLDKYDMDIDADTDDLRKFFHDAQDSGTPLCNAVYCKNLATVQELLRRGARPDHAGASGHPPTTKAIGDAMFDGFLPALGPLLDAGADPANALISAVRQGNIEAAQICLAHGADPEVGLQEIQAKRAERLTETSNDEAESDREQIDEEKERITDEDMSTLLLGWHKD